MTDRLELDIVRLGAQGDGVADGPAGPLYVPLTLPGERVAAAMKGDRGRLIEVLRPSPDRVSAACRHFASCGGCTAQHVGRQPYAAWKRAMVVTAFAHRGLEPQVDALVGIEPGTRRRAAFTAMKRNGQTLLGFHEEGSHTLVDLEVCPVLVPAIEKALPGLRAIAETILADGGEARITVTAANGGLDIVLDGAGNSPPDARTSARIAQLAAAAGALRVNSGGHLVMQSALPRLRLGPVDVALPPGAFIQATAAAEAAVTTILLAATRKARHIADLFSGLGTFTFALASRARVLAADGDRPAIEALTAAIKSAQGVKPIEAKVRDLFDAPLSRQELDTFDAVVFDPPRQGAKAQAEMLARSKVPVVCAVSCNPATLARDCRILVDGGYTIARVVPIDQFVWSPHVEAVAILERRRGT